jgi:hypothetical protein
LEATKDCASGSQLPWVGWLLS